MKKKMKWKKRLLLTAMLILCLLLAACSSNGKTSAPSGGQTAPGAPPMEDNGAAYDESAGLLPGADPKTGGDSGVYRDENAKIIRSADLEIQTTAYDQSFQTLERLTDRTGGYYESAETRGGGYYDQSAARYGSFTVRVPKDQYKAFMDSVGDVGHVTFSSESAEDVGEQYFDTEARLKTQRTKLDRLQTLLEKAATMEDIIDLENALAEVELQIEQLTGALRQYDSLVDYATIHITLSEVRRVSGQPDESAGLGARLAAAFSNGWASFSDGLGNLIVWCAYNFMGILLVLAAAVAAVIVLYRRRRAVALRAAEHQEPPEEPKPPKDP